MTGERFAVYIYVGRKRVKGLSNEKSYRPLSVAFPYVI